MRVGGAEIGKASVNRSRQPSITDPAFVQEHIGMLKMMRKKMLKKKMMLTLLKMISGARYSGVPHSVHVRPFTRLANPKSVICKSENV